MVNIIRRFPFTSLLGLFGFFVGLLFLSTLDFSISINYNFSEFLRNPVNLFLNYFKESFRMIIKAAGLGIAVGIALGFAGFIIDFIRKRPEPGISESGSIQ
jgi:hypothetical protein